MLTTKNIYLCEDDCDDVYFFKLVLKDICNECKVTICEDGEQLLDNLRNCLQLPDLIFLDINMPKITGLDVLKIIKADNRLCTVPVVVFTSTKNETPKRIAYELGAAYFFIKPAQFEIYKEQVNKALATVRNDLDNQDLVS